MTDARTLNRYGRLCAEVYDLDKPTGSLFDIGYYTARLKELDGPVLEAACGTGRLTIPLVEAGIDVWGFDHSPDMLAVARANAQARGLSLRLSQAAFQAFAYDVSFAAVIVPASSFILLDDFDEAMGVLDRFRRHLAPSGLLLVDLPPMSLFEAASRPRSWIAANGDLIRLESQIAAADAVAQRRVNHDRYERWRDGRLIETELELFAYRVWGLEEFRMALAANGFVEIEVAADYRPGRTPSPDSRILNFAARAP